ncbi:hypothetical protein BHF71_07330 [Vulcanibacillus modesticaldus]|uniref:Metallo-beta-lactamase domain-containing protein n=1 Tax=Vulcanibacillus modesticaldus TaxID=337097 RepID=A0A1D2YW33_9BACI|nr:MBL fold metallo-hydrolase [Vulcanibacillus modesticaldus]OEF99912.1 hypothetical protein BHF71_07330 [Vulcanibacillus modesticaldus]
MNQVKSFEAKVKRLGVFKKVYVYEIDGLLIDTGAHSTFKQLLPFFEQLSVEQIALTHIHEDHSGNAHWWWKNKQVPIYVHNLSLDYAQERGKYPLYRRLFWGNRLPFHAEPFPNLIETNNYQFQIIETPGHSDDHISIYEAENGWLFTGDLYITQKPKLFLSFESIPKTISSLKKLLDLDIDYIFCAHSGKLANGKQKLQDKLDYLLELKNTILDLHQKGYDKNEIVKQLFPKKSILIYLSQNEFSYERAVESILNND